MNRRTFVVGSGALLSVVSVGIAPARTADLVRLRVEGRDASGAVHEFVGPVARPGSITIRRYSSRGLTADVGGMIDGLPNIAADDYLGDECVVSRVELRELTDEEAATWTEAWAP